ncbi:NANOG neighbor homeobox [Crocuta crocuta]
MPETSVTRDQMSLLSRRNMNVMLIREPVRGPEGASRQTKTASGVRTSLSVGLVPIELGLADSAIQKDPAMRCDQNPEQSNRNHSDDERKGKENWKEREGEGKEEEVEEKLEEEQEMEEETEEHPQERLVSKPLLNTLWATFKLNKCPTIGDSQSLAFEFNMTVKQIKQWFRKKRKKYKKVMCKQKPKKRLKRC